MSGRFGQDKRSMIVITEKKTPFMKSMQFWTLNVKSQ